MSRNTVVNGKAKDAMTFSFILNDAGAATLMDGTVLTEEQVKALITATRYAKENAAKERKIKAAQRKREAAQKREAYRAKVEANKVARAKVRQKRDADRIRKLNAQIAKAQAEIKKLSK